MMDYSVKLEKLNHFLALGINIEPGKDRQFDRWLPSFSIGAC